jgi:hypothetical protein
MYSFEPWKILNVCVCVCVCGGIMSTQNVSDDVSIKRKKKKIWKKCLENGVFGILFHF